MKTNYLLRNQQSSIRISQSGNHRLAAVLEFITVEKPSLEIRLRVVVVAPMYITTALENFHVEVPSFMDLRSVVMGEDDYTFKAKFSGEGVSTFSEVVKEKLKEFTGEYTDYTFVRRKLEDYSQKVSIYAETREISSWSSYPREGLAVYLSKHSPLLRLEMTTSIIPSLKTKRRRRLKWVIASPSLSLAFNDQKTKRRRRLKWELQQVMTMDEWFEVCVANRSFILGSCKSCCGV